MRVPSKASSTRRSIRLWQSRETHSFLRAEFSIIEGEEEIIPYPSHQKPPRQKRGMER